MSRPGWDEPADDGTGTLQGYNADLSTSYPITFDDDALANAEMMGNNTSVACETDNVCAYEPHAGAATGNGLVDFQGEPMAGAWKVCVADSAGSNGATLESATLTFERN